MPDKALPKRAVDLVTEKLLGIDSQERFSKQPQDLELRAKRILEPADVYLENEPTVKEWLRDLVPSRSGSLHYFQSLFPSAFWIRRYNFRWLLGDAIAGITVGLVVVPQAMAYADLAQLPPAYGLYTSFTGAALYWLFGTSKDIVIGTTAVGSLLVGQVVSHVQEQSPGKYTNQDVAHALSLLAGAIMLFFGIARLGWIIEFIPYIPISAFVTAASITIMSTQVPVALGIPNINTREAPYKVIINTCQNLPKARLDAAIGIGSIVLLFALRDFCSAMEKRQPARKRMWSTISSLRLTFTMLLFTLISFLVHRNLTDSSASKFRIVGKIEAGFQAASVPRPDIGLLKLIVSQLPAIVIILVIEHIAIAKSMGRLYNYSVVPSQEIVALGAANLLSPFVGGYVCTGSFGASAVLSKAGVKTPLAGLLSALMLVLALYVLTGVFYYIPKAALAGLIIHAVCNLMTPPKNLYKYWQLSPVELLIWIAGVVLAVFESLEISIYVGIILSLVLLLVRMARTRGTFLGTAHAQRVVGPYDSAERRMSSDSSVTGLDNSRAVFVPLNHEDASNPDIKLETPHPGVFVYRFSEGYNYTNQAFHAESLMQFIIQNTRRQESEDETDPHDRLWNDPGPQAVKKDKHLPVLKAIICDFSSVNHMDVTSVQGLSDLRNTLDRYAAPDTVEWHFANVHNRWTRRALAAAGFGYPLAQDSKGLQAWQPSYNIASILLGDDDFTEVKNKDKFEIDEERGQARNTKVGQPSPVVEVGDALSGITSFETGHSVACESRPMAAVFGVDRPFFHVDLVDALDSAVRNAQGKERQA
ncbi:Sulfate permease [Paramyrothecium foliicola]|nr:Sulfate permease [Paramyrothecium foliicola]